VTGMAMAAAGHWATYLRQMTNDAPIMMMTLLSRQSLPRPTSSTCCRASAIGRLPTTDSIRRHLDDNEVG